MLDYRVTDKCEKLTDKSIKVTGNLLFLAKKKCNPLTRLSSTSQKSEDECALMKVYT